MIIWLDADQLLQVSQDGDFGNLSFAVRDKQRLSDTADVRFEGDHAWVSEDAVRAWYGAAGEPREQQLDRMFAYAATNGWYRPDERRVRAHVEVCAPDRFPPS